MIAPRIRLTIGPTNRITGNATAHDVIHAVSQIPKKFSALNPIASQVDIAVIKKVMKQVSKNPNATGSLFFGKNGFIIQSSRVCSTIN